MNGDDKLIIIARGICCPAGCRFIGDSEDGETCYCDTPDFCGSGIEDAAIGILRNLNQLDPEVGQTTTPPKLDEVLCQRCLANGLAVAASIVRPMRKRGG